MVILRYLSQVSSCFCFSALGYGKTSITFTKQDMTVLLPVILCRTKRYFVLWLDKLQCFASVKEKMAIPLSTFQLKGRELVKSVSSDGKRKLLILKYKDPKMTEVRSEDGACNLDTHSTKVTHVTEVCTQRGKVCACFDEKFMLPFSQEEQNRSAHLQAEGIHNVSSSCMKKAIIVFCRWQKDEQKLESGTTIHQVSLCHEDMSWLQLANTPTDIVISNKTCRLCHL